MAEINLPQNTGPVEPSLPLSHPQNQEAQEKNKANLTQDSLSVSTQNEVQSAAQKTAAPELESPDNGITLRDYFRIISQTALNFRHQLMASDLVDIESRARTSTIAAYEALNVSDLLKQRETKTKELDEETKSKIEEIQNKLLEMKEGTEDQQKLIDLINSKNSLEEQVHKNMAEVYDHYMEELKQIGVVDLGNGQFYIPKESLYSYNTLTQQYQAVVNSYNEFMTLRKNEIDQYNAATIAYNQKVAENNKFINDFIEKNNLSDHLNKMGIVLYTQTPAELRNLSGSVHQIQSPPLLISASNVTVQPVPNYFQNHDVPNLKNLPTPSSVNIHHIFEKIFVDQYEKHVGPINESISQYQFYWNYIKSQKFSSDDSENNDPLLNTKRLALRVLPDSLIDPALDKVPAKSSAVSPALQAVSLGNGHIDVILGRAMLKKAIEDLNLKIFEEKDATFKEMVVNQMVDKLLILSVGLMNNHSIQSLFPSVGIIAQNLDNLPKDSPAFAILFALSLSNRIQEDTTLGITDKAIHTFLNEVPELAHLPEEDKQKIISILNLGQLIAASKLLENNLGLPGLFTQILPTLIPHLDLKSIVSQATQEGKQSLMELQTTLLNYFVEQGYPKNESQFLAELGTQLADRGVTFPSATSMIKPDSFDKILLIDSVKASLILANYPLNEADHLAHEVVDQTLNEGPFPTPKQFRTNLESNLKDLGLGDKSEEISLQTLVVPSPVNSLNFLRPLPPPVVATREPSAEKPSLTEETLPISPSQPNLREEAASFQPIPSYRETIRPSETPKSAPSVTPSSPSPTVDRNFVTPPLTSVPPAETDVKNLSFDEIIKLLEKRSFQLLVPQLGAQLSKQITEELARSLFGNSHPDSQDVAAIKSPFSLINIVKDQIHNLKADENQEWATALSQTFKESMKTMTSFYSFSLKIMDPAYLFIYSSDSGIIYGDSKIKKKSIDILI